MRTADIEMNTKHENYLSRSEKLRLKKLEPAWEVMLIMLINYIWIGVSIVV